MVKVFGVKFDVDMLIVIDEVFGDMVNCDVEYIYLVLLKFWFV